MKEVRTAPYQIAGHVVSAILYYGPNDLVDHWDLVAGNLNLSKMTYKQVKDLTGLTEDDILRVSQAIQRSINAQEGRR